MFGAIFESVFSGIIILFNLLFQALKIVVTLALDLPIIIGLLPLYVTALIITYMRNFNKGAVKWH